MPVLRPRAGTPTAVALLVAACASTLLAVLPASAQRGGLDAVARDTLLENGLHVIVVPNPTVPLVTIQVTIRNGAFTQLTREEEGLPHLLEHMLFKSFGTSGFSEAANKLNAHYNGTTGDETVTYYLTLPADNLDRGVRLLADLMRSPRFDESDLAAEQEVVRGELERSASSPAYLLSTTVNAHVWGGARGRKNAIGDVSTINGATPARLKRMYDRFYVPNNAALIFSGDVSADAAFASASQHFRRWRRGADPFEDLTIPPIRPLRVPAVVVVPLETNDVTMLVRWQGPSVRTEREATFAADVFAAVVNDPVSSFQTRLVDSGLFQSVSMTYLTRAHVGPISIHATTTADRLVAASTALRAELSRFAGPGYVTAEILAIAKKRQEVDWAMEMETPSGLASFIGDLWSVADLGYARDYIDAMQAQQVEDLERFVSAYLTGRPRVTGIMMSPLTRQELGPRVMAALAPWRR
jgi:zinc protease